MLNGKSARVTVKEILETNLDAPCERCGHAKGQHAQFIDNQSSSASYAPERRHCLHLGGDGTLRVDNTCACTRFMLTADKKLWVPDPVDVVFDVQTSKALEEVRAELARARAAWPNMTTVHEGYAIIAEELDELWDLVRVNQNKHDRKAMRKEAMQIAAMAIRFMEDLCDGEAH